MNNITPKINTSGSYSAPEIRQAIYILVGLITTIAIYTNGGISCFINSKEPVDSVPKKPLKSK